MAEEDPRLIDAMWHAADLTRAYLGQDRAGIAACLAGLDVVGQEHLLAWLILNHDAVFDDLGKPDMSVREMDAVAGLAPPGFEFATTTAVRRVAAKETGLVQAVEGLELAERVHAIATCTVVMLLGTVGRAAALQHLDGETAGYERMGYPRPAST